MSEVPSERISQDLKERNLALCGVICGTKGGKIQVIVYNDKGLVTNIFPPVDQLSLSEPLRGRMFRELGTLTLPTKEGSDKDPHL